MANSIKMVLVTLLATGGFIGLAIVGEGGPQKFFAQPQLAALAGVTLMLAIATFFTRVNLDPGQREERESRWVFIGFAAVAVLAGWFPAFCDRREFWTFGADAVRWSGVLLFALGGVLRLWPIFVLGRRFSGLVAIQRDHPLQTHGIYSLVRHPSYAGILLILVGWALTFRSVAGWSWPRPPFFR